MALEALRKPSEVVGLAGEYRSEVEANPSTRISCAQYRNESATICKTRGWLKLTVFPVPVSLM